MESEFVKINVIRVYSMLFCKTTIPVFFGDKFQINSTYSEWVNFGNFGKFYKS